MATPEWFEETLKGIAVSLGTLLAAWGVVRRRISQDNLDIQKHSGEAAWMVDIRRERDECLRREREIHALHQKDAEAMAGLQLRLALMDEKFERLELEHARFKRLLLEARPDLAPLFNSDFGGLPEMRHPPRKDPLR